MFHIWIINFPTAPYIYLTLSMNGHCMSVALAFGSCEGRPSGSPKTVWCKEMAVCSVSVFFLGSVATSYFNFCSFSFFQYSHLQLWSWYHSWSNDQCTDIVRMGSFPSINVFWDVLSSDGASCCPIESFIVSLFLFGHFLTSHLAVLGSFVLVLILALKALFNLLIMRCRDLLYCGFNFSSSKHLLFNMPSWLLRHVQFSQLSCILSALITFTNLDFNSRFLLGLLFFVPSTPHASHCSICWCIVLFLIRVPV